jgi:hypothetical protein
VEQTDIVSQLEELRNILVEPAEALVRNSADLSFVNVYYDPEYYWEKCFPTLYPYGRGGPSDEHYKLASSAKYHEHILCRGASIQGRRFQNSCTSIFATYLYEMKRRSGGISALADKEQITMNEEGEFITKNKSSSITVGEIRKLPQMLNRMITNSINSTNINNNDDNDDDDDNINDNEDAQHLIDDYTSRFHNGVNSSSSSSSSSSSNGNSRSNTTSSSSSSSSSSSCCSSSSSSSSSSGGGGSSSSSGGNGSNSYSRNDYSSSFNSINADIPAFSSSSNGQNVNYYDLETGGYSIPRRDIQNLNTYKYRNSYFRFNDHIQCYQYIQLEGSLDDYNENENVDANVQQNDSEPMLNSKMEGTIPLATATQSLNLNDIDMFDNSVNNAVNNNINSDNNNTNENDDINKINKLISRLVPYAKSLTGSSLQIMHEKLNLMAMVSSPVINNTAVWRWFLTFAYADLYESRLFELIVNDANYQMSIEEREELVANLTSTDRSAMLRDHPALAARIFDSKITCIFDHVLMGQAKPFGDIVDFWIRIEVKNN